MVRPSERRMKKKYVRVPSGKTVLRFERDSGKKPKCAITKKPLQGVARGKISEIKKLSKTERRPSVPLGGILSSKARDIIYEEAIKVKAGIKEMKDVRLTYRKYVSQLLNKIEL